jgi:hypothetical protein
LPRADQPPGSPLQPALRRGSRTRLRMQQLTLPRPLSPTCLNLNRSNAFHLAPRLRRLLLANHPSTKTASRIGAVHQDFIPASPLSCIVLIRRSLSGCLIISCNAARTNRVQPAERRFALPPSASEISAHESTAAEPFLHLLRIKILVTLRHSSH